MQITHLSVCYLLYSSYLDPKKKNSITSDITNNINEITLIIVIVVSVVNKMNFQFLFSSECNES